MEIATTPKLFGPNIHTIDATVKAPASTGKTTAMKKGQLVFLSADGANYEALTAAGTTMVGVLGEDITPTRQKSLFGVMYTYKVLELRVIVHHIFPT